MKTVCKASQLKYTLTLYSCVAQCARKHLKNVSKWLAASHTTQITKWPATRFIKSFSHFLNKTRSFPFQLLLGKMFNKKHSWAITGTKTDLQDCYRNSTVHCWTYLVQALAWPTSVLICVICWTILKVQIDEKLALVSLWLRVYHGYLQRGHKIILELSTLK